MKNFIKTIFAVLFGNMIFFGIFFLILIMIAVGASMSSSESKTVQIASSSILNLDLQGEFSDLPQHSDFELGKKNKLEHTYSMYELTQSIRHAATDSRIKAIHIPLGIDIMASYAQLDQLRSALAEFKASKKPIIAYGEVASQKSYYLATVSDKIYLNPHGGMDLRGFGAQITFLKNMLNKLEVEPQIFYAGKFKSATEPLRLDKMSEENKQQTKELLGDIATDVIANIATDRKLTSDAVNASINQMQSMSPEDALSSKLIDGLKYQDEAESDLRAALKIDASKDLPLVGIDEYIVDSKLGKQDGDIAVYVAEGDIVSGKSTEGSVGSETVVKDMRAMAENDDIKGVVLRINSPGGSALASAVMLREIELLRKKKPVVVSMGNLAASGGYYIATSASKVFAEPHTITGSIGVFGIVPNVGKMLENKLGVTFDEVELNDHAVMGINKPLENAEAVKIQSEIERTYATFKNEVSKGRKMVADSVESIAQGRVWSGKRAKMLGLVDELGGLDAAVQYLAKETKSDAKSFYFYNQRKSKWEQWLEDMTSQAWIQNLQARWMNEQLGDYAIYYREMVKWTTMRGVQMRMGYSVTI